MEIFDDLPAIWDFFWQQLQKAPHQKKHPWRTPVLASLDGDQVNQRTVVLRRVGQKERCLRFYSDFRSAKIRQKGEKLHFSWLFYNSSKQIQLRIKTEGAVVDTEELEKIWQGLPVYARSTYAATLPPGTAITYPSDGLPDGFFNQSTPETDVFRKNFAAVDNFITEIEFLQLHREGHRRARWSWEENEWKGTWLIP